MGKQIVTRTSGVADCKDANGQWIKSYNHKVNERSITLLQGVWQGIELRCNSLRPCYLECVNGFSSFQEFGDWATQQVGYLNRDANGRRWHLDKDILCVGNKVYCSEYCVFLPAEINCFVVSRTPSISKRILICGTVRYAANYITLSKGLKSRIGTFDTREEAFAAYKARKESYAKELAAKWQSQIDPRAYEALMNYTVEITD